MGPKPNEDEGSCFSVLELKRWQAAPGRVLGRGKAGTPLAGDAYHSMSYCDRLLERRGVSVMMKFLLFCILLVLCWPLALLALVLYPLVWLVLLPFRLVGIAVGGVLELVSAIIFLPARMLRAI